MGAWCTGMAQRALDMLVEHANQRVTFGEKLADRQAIQWWVADAAMKLHACRLMVMDAAVKQDDGRDVRMEASMIKVFATEMATEIIDHAQQSFGAMGVTQELPLSMMAPLSRSNWMNWATGKSVRLSTRTRFPALPQSVLRMRRRTRRG